ncbi:MAG: TetR/AcrR family transcriptional regulator [Sulfurovum sp.]|nr:TetR/AcrR family transcriptional regulator [Sulfurovum sp.]
MAIIVDKEQKRKDIALACKDIILEQGIHNLTISHIAKTAGIGKGTFYEYFSSKEALLFELVNILLREYNVRKEYKLSQVATTIEKIKVFSDFFYEEESEDLRNLYKMFVGISLLTPNCEMMAFQTECFEYYYGWFERIIDEGIAKGEVPASFRALSRGLFSTAEGMFIASETTHSMEDLKGMIHHYIDTIFALAGYLQQGVNE